MNAQRRLTIGLLVIAAVGIAGAVLLFRHDQAQCFRSYLVGFVYWTCIAVGSTGILMLQFVTGGQWGMVLRRGLTAAGATMPLLAVLCIPLLTSIDQIYVWHDRIMMNLDPVLVKKAAFLSPTFFVIRSAAYFAVLIPLAGWMLTWQRRYAATGDEKYIRRLRRLSAPGMFVISVVLSLALIDWVMSLEPRWYSTIYALIWITGSMLAGMSFSAMVSMLARKTSLTDKQKKDIGNLLLALIMLWAYCSFSRYLLIWSGDLSDEIPWYLARLSGAWGIVALALVLLHFALPFLLLLSRSFKHARRWLLSTCIFLLLMRFVDAVWLINPAFGGTSVWGPIFADAFWLIVIGSVWGALFLWFYAREAKTFEEYA